LRARSGERQLTVGAGNYDGASLRLLPFERQAYGLSAFGLLQRVVHGYEILAGVPEPHE
jgi:hypothetical protein